jgi:hypothetical protein
VIFIVGSAVAGSAVVGAEVGSPVTTADVARGSEVGNGRGASSDFVGRVVIVMGATDVGDVVDGAVVNATGGCDGESVDGINVGCSVKLAGKSGVATDGSRVVVAMVGSWVAGVVPLVGAVVALEGGGTVGFCIVGNRLCSNVGAWVKAGALVVSTGMPTGDPSGTVGVALMDGAMVGVGRTGTVGPGIGTGERVGICSIDEGRPCSNVGAWV